MKFDPSNKNGDNTFLTDHGSTPFTANITSVALKNQNFRTALWTGNHLQMTLMSIPSYGEIGLEMHPDTDQFIRVECGQALVLMESCREAMNFEHHLKVGYGIFVPAGTWHNIKNIGSCPLKLSSIYAPPQHPTGTVHHTKEDAEA